MSAITRREQAVAATRVGRVAPESHSGSGTVMEPIVTNVSAGAARPVERVLAAPDRLGLDSRTMFRRSAVELLEQLAEGAGRLVIDLSATRQVDSAGLGALMLIQRKAAERRQSVCLRGASEELRFLLVLTKLDDLFELERGAGA
ncbi:MAG: STAS domain-containing protein [Acidimicrobiales bacterium]